MSKISLPLTKNGNDDGWDMPTLHGATVCGAAAFYDSEGELIGYTVSVGWNDDDSDNREVIIDAVNSIAQLRADAAFLLARLDEFERDALQEDDGEYVLRQFAGHVSPAMERLRDILPSAEAA